MKRLDGIPESMLIPLIARAKSTNTKTNNKRRTI